jgi:hypothetical protein
VPFEFAYRLSGGAPTIQGLIINQAAIKRGDMVNLAAGQVALAATTNANLVGQVLETRSGLIAGTSIVKVITDEDAVYRVTDPVARSIGATLDIAGASGAQTVAASVNKEFVVMADAGADEPTLVRFNLGKHFKNKAQ